MQPAQAPRGLPEPLAQMVLPAPQVLLGLMVPPELLASALRVPLGLRVPVLPAQLEPQVQV